MTLPAMNKKNKKASAMERQAATALAEKIAAAAQKAQDIGDEKVRNAPKEAFSITNLTFQQCFAMLGAPSAVIWLLMCWSYYSTQKENPPMIPSICRQLLGSRYVAHLGPHPIPGLIRVRDDLEMELFKLDDPFAYEHERTESLLAIEAVTQRRMAVVDIVKRRGIEWFLPVLFDLVTESEHADIGINKSQSHFDSQVRIALDIISATPAADRELPIEFFKKLVSTNSAVWKGESRAEEARAILLYKLLHCPANCAKVRGCEEVERFIQEEGGFIESVSDVQWRKDLYAHENHDILRKCAGLINKNTRAIDFGGETFPIPEAQERKSPSFQTKLDLRSLEVSAFYYTVWPMMRFMIVTGYDSMNKGSAFARVLASAWMGGALLEGIYRAEEHLIQTKWYYENSVLASLGMVFSHCAVTALVLTRCPYVFAPYLILRFRDSTADTFRFV
jgi:hypothetical protein